MCWLTTWSQSDSVVGIVLSLFAYMLTQSVLEGSKLKFLSETKSQQK